MRINFDREANALLIQFKECKSFATKELDDDIIIDTDEKGNPIAIEMLNVIPRISAEHFSKIESNIPSR